MSITPEQGVPDRGMVPRHAEGEQPGGDRGGIDPQRVAPEAEDGDDGEQGQQPEYGVHDLLRPSVSSPGDISTIL
ncbi:MAG: hypothetical protein U5L11_08975 [Arhodomonas sp.]|nr:hypothetical protein [Arhodomonas sp.]